MFLSSPVSKQNLCTSGRNTSCTVPVILCTLAAPFVRYLSCELLFVPINLVTISGEKVIYFVKEWGGANVLYYFKKSSLEIKLSAP